MVVQSVGRSQSFKENLITAVGWIKLFIVHNKQYLEGPRALGNIRTTFKALDP